MKLSVCIPTFNSAPYIRDCIESVLAQKGVEFEVIVFDNASQDDTWDIVRSFSDGRIRAFRSTQNRGMTANFNQALTESRGQYIKLLCSDDLLETDALQTQTKFMDKHPEMALATGATCLIDSKNEELGTVRWFSRPVLIDSLELRALSLIYGNVVGEPSVVLFRREAWLRAGPFREGLVTLIDLDMWFRLSCQGRVGYLPLQLCRIRRHPLSMTNQFRGAGEVQEAVLRMTENLLHELRAGPLVRRISLGKVTASHLRHAIFGLKQGRIRWPASAVASAFRLDPCFLGLIMYLSVFRSGLLGLKVGRDAKLSVCVTSTLNGCEQNGLLPEMPVWLKPPF